MTETYDASHITVLEGLTPVRERPAMYIGSTDTRGLHHLVYEVVTIPLMKPSPGIAPVLLSINKDGSVSVIDNGRGIPVDTMEKNGKSALEVVLTVLHAGGKFDKETYQVSGGLHGVGVSVVNALSNWLSARVYRDGNIYEMRFSQGKANPAPSQPARKPSAEMIARYQSVVLAARLLFRRTNTTGQDNAETDEKTGRHFSPSYGAKMTGTGSSSSSRTRPSSRPQTFDYDILAHRLRELAFLNARPDYHDI